MDLAKYKKLIFGGLFIVILVVKQLFGIDVGGWFGITADIDPETGAFVATGFDKAVDIVLGIAGLFGIFKPANKPMDA